MTAQKMDIRKTVKEWLLLLLGTALTAAGVYFFKFPNNFSTGGVSGIAVILFTLRKMRELEGELRLQNLPQNVEKVIRAAGIQRLIKITERTE